MKKKKRTSFEDAFDLVIKNLKINVPMTISEIASNSNLSWLVVDKVIRVVMNIQDFIYGHKIVVLIGKRSKIILLELRVDMTHLPSTVREWFIEEKFFKGPEKKHYNTEEIKSILNVENNTNKRIHFEDAINLMLEALKLEDELSVLELSRRTGLNRRTVDRTLNFALRFQDMIAKYFVRLHEGKIVLINRPDLYSLDESRMKLLLAKMYDIALHKKLSTDKERTLFQIA